MTKDDSMHPLEKNPPRKKAMKLQPAGKHQPKTRTRGGSLMTVPIMVFLISLGMKRGRRGCRTLYIHEKPIKNGSLPPGGRH